MSSRQKENLNRAQGRDINNSHIMYTHTNFKTELKEVHKFKGNEKGRREASINSYNYRWLFRSTPGNNFYPISDTMISCLLPSLNNANHPMHFHQTAINILQFAKSPSFPVSLTYKASTQYQNIKFPKTLNPSLFQPTLNKFHYLVISTA